MPPVDASEPATSTRLPRPSDAGTTARPMRANRAGAARRAMVIDVAVDHFSRHGYQGASLAAIAADAGITDAGLLYHFHTKSELFAAVIAAREEPFVEAFTSTPATFAELLDGFRHAVDASLAHPELVRFQAALSGEMAMPGHPFHDHYVANQRSALASLTATLTRFIDDGQLSSGTDARQLARELIALHRGLRAEWAITPDEIDLPAALSAALDRVLRSASS
ncbi:TetR/AcrR family transcriptional regulator [Agromyces sp. Root81]|uniref:TetR/AcrR family transcriptional regulator n=1 Tax=Agromyces sp. Root81 TaxID=1736601 RepID=UPI0009EB25CB|nr:TetR family transcriptional regulator [Agromyces sp. Root81]